MIAQNNKNDITPHQLAHSHLLSYISAMYPNYKVGLMHQVLARHLEQAEAGKIKRLLIFAPPRHGKTMLVSQFFPAWCMGRNPSWQIIAASYGQELANDMGKAVKNQIDSDLHRNIFAGCCIDPSSRSVRHCSTLQRGEYYSIGVGGAAVGRGANLLLIDDPVKSREEVESKLVREKLKTWYKAVAYTRLMPDNRIVIINTRWHEDDLSGYVLSEFPQEKWVVLDFKAIAEENDPLGRKEGDPLWEEAYPLLSLEAIREIVGSYEFTSQYQQRPVAKKGGMVQYKWFGRYDKNNPPKDITKIVISWDTANKKEELHDPTCATVWGITKNGYYLLDVINKKLEYPDLKKKVISLHNTHSPSCHLVEDKGSGISLIQDFKRTIIPVIPISTKNLDKEIRFASVTDLFEAGKVFLPENAHWLADYEHQLCSFPSSKHDDMVDSTSQFLKWASKKKYKRKPQSQLYWK